jgi:hypothetical protein
MPNDRANGVVGIRGQLETDDAQTIDNEVVARIANAADSWDALAAGVAQHIDPLPDERRVQFLRNAGAFDNSRRWRRLAQSQLRRFIVIRGPKQRVLDLLASKALLHASERAYLTKLVWREHLNADAIAWLGHLEAALVKRGRK